MNALRAALTFPLRLLVWVYKYTISPLLPNACRYSPTCSDYMLEALSEWGPWKGTWLGLKRISRCHPWGDHGYDPVPKRKTESDKTQSTRPE